MYELKIEKGEDEVLTVLLRKTHSALFYLIKIKKCLISHREIRQNKEFYSFNLTILTPYIPPAIFPSEDLNFTSIFCFPFNRSCGIAY